MILLLHGYKSKVEILSPSYSLDHEGFAKRKTKIIEEENRSILLSSMTEHSITRDIKHRKIIYVSRWGAFYRSLSFYSSRDVAKSLSRRTQKKVRSN
jgi:hypothetical protein